MAKVIPIHTKTKPDPFLEHLQERAEKSSKKAVEKYVKALMEISKNQIKKTS